MLEHRRFKVLRGESCYKYPSCTDNQHTGVQFNLKSSDEVYSITQR